MFERVILVIGMPRSGTSWLSQIIDSSPQVRFRLSPFFSYEFKNAVDERSSKTEYEHVFKGAYESNSRFMDQTERREAGHYPAFADKQDRPEVLLIKMTRFHNLIDRMLALFDNMKVVAIVRHPCGAIHSWLTNPSEFPQAADPMQEWRTGACRRTGPGEFWGFEDWKQVTGLHADLERHLPDRFIILQYESLVDDPVRETKKLFSFLGLEYTAPTHKFLLASQQRHVDDPYAVFKHPRVKDRWREELDPDIASAILHDIAGTALMGFMV